MYKFCLGGLIAAGLMCCLLRQGSAEEPAAVAGAVTNSVTQILSEAQQVWRSSLQLQDQLRSAMLTLEQDRKDSELAIKDYTNVVAEGLSRIERGETANTKLLDRLRQQQDSNRSLILASAVFAILGVLALVVMVWLQNRAMNRLGEIAVLCQQMPARNRSLAPALGSGDAVLPVPGAADASSQRLLGAVERMEKKLEELEQSAQPPPQPVAASPQPPAATAAPSPAIPALTRAEAGAARPSQRASGTRAGHRDGLERAAGRPRADRRAAQPGPVLAQRGPARQSHGDPGRNHFP
jgi:hypothetical protein